MPQTHLHKKVIPIPFPSEYFSLSSLHTAKNHIIHLIFTPPNSIISGEKYRCGTNKYRYGFNGKEKDDEGMGGGSQTYDYGFRIYNPSLAKFLSVDPLFASFAYYTPYQFSSNMPISCIDIDGLEAKLAIACTNHTPEDDAAFRGRAARLEKEYDYVYVESTNGLEMLSDLAFQTVQQGSIQRIVSFHHSGSGIYMEEDNGFYKQESANAAHPRKASVIDLGKSVINGDIKFSKDAVWVLGGCSTAYSQNINTGENDVQQSLAATIAKEIGITTIGADGAVYPEIVNGKESGKLCTDGNFYIIERFYRFTLTMEDGSQKILDHQNINDVNQRELMDSNVSYVTIEPMVQVTNLGNKIDPNAVN
jgi:RHS repeat-associated protein